MNFTCKDKDFSALLQVFSGIFGQSNKSKNTSRGLPLSGDLQIGIIYRV